MKENFITFKRTVKNKDVITDPIDFIMSDGKEGLRADYFSRFIEKDTRVMEKNYDFSKYLDYDNLFYIQKHFNKTLKELKNPDLHYRTVHIPKANSSKKRRLDIPSDDLKRAQETGVHVMKKSLLLLEHNQAYAYVEGRSTVQNAEFHQKSNHFARVDFKDFFPSITDVVIKQNLNRLGFLALDSEVNKPNAIKKEEVDKLRKDIVNDISILATFEKKLPQGSPLSPFISNLVMIPFDYHMIKLLKDTGILYTRYADDITFSSFYAFADRKEEAKERLHKLVEQAAINAYGTHNFLNINKPKTLISTKQGKNRVTGIKINKDNELSIGYKEKRQLKQNLANLIIAKLEGKQVNQEIKEQTLGMLSYLKGVEPDYGKYMEKTLLTKFKIKSPSISQFLN